MNNLNKVDDDFPEDDMFLEAKYWEGETSYTQPITSDCSKQTVKQIIQILKMRGIDFHPMSRTAELLALLNANALHMELGGGKFVKYLNVFPNLGLSSIASCQW